MISNELFCASHSRNSTNIRTRSKVWRYVLMSVALSNACMLFSASTTRIQPLDKSLPINLNVLRNAFIATAPLQPESVGKFRRSFI